MRVSAGRRLSLVALGLVLLALAPTLAGADVSSKISNLPYTQPWSATTAPITTNDDWSPVPGVQGYLGDDSASTATNTDPRAITTDNTTTDVIANRSTPNTDSAGGVAEFDGIPDPTVALQGSATADYPNVVFHLDITGKQDVNFSFDARDVDGSADNAAQQIAVQYRVGTTGGYTRAGLADTDGYVTDATTAGTATQTTPVSVTLPDATDNQSSVYIRVLTTNAGGSDEWVGIDNVNIAAGSGPPPPPPPPTNQPPTADCGTGIETNQGTAASTTVTATDPDTITNIDVTGVSPAPAPGTISRTAFTPAPAPGGTATAEITVSDNVPTNQYTVTVTAANGDGPPQSTTCTFPVTVIATIGAVQGSVSDSDNGTAHRSPFAPASGSGAGQQAVVRGVITQKTRQRRSFDGANQNSFFIQNTNATRDSDPNSSDGIFVFQNTFNDLIGGYVPQVGDEVVLRGTVSEFFNLTQLSSARLVRTVASGIAVDAVTPPFVADPPDDLGAANRYWERREGMRGKPPAAAVVLNGSNVFPSTQDAEVWLVKGDHPIAERSSPYARRSFRDPHPLDNQDPPLFDDGNGYRILLGSLGVKGTTGNNTEKLAPARTFDTVANASAGGLYYSFGKYQLQPEQNITPVAGVDPAADAPPSAPNRSGEYSIANYNVENLYDFRDDPNDGCDFAGNTGCPGVNPPFDYVPASDAEYQARLGDISSQIRNDLHAPEIILVQEAEDQDICSVSGGALSCGTANNADGRPDTLQELALRIAAAGGPEYQAAYDRDGSDDRGIVSAFMYRTDRVELPPAPADNPVLGPDGQVPYRSGENAYNNQQQNPKALNAPLPGDVDTSTGTDGNEVYTRDPQVALFRIRRSGSLPPIELYALSNHFSSVPNARVGQRREQAAYNAAIVRTLRGSDASTRVLSGGDFNVYPRPDDPFPSSPSDQLAPLYNEGLLASFDIVAAEVPASAYSYVFQGQAQTLDQQFYTPSLRSQLDQARIAHINSDFPADTPGDGPRGVSDHDPIVSQFRFPAPAVPGTGGGGTGGGSGGGPGPGPGIGDDGRPRIAIKGLRRGACNRARSAATARVRVFDSSPLRQVSVSLDGRRIASSRNKVLRLRLPRRAQRPGRHRLVVSATDSAGNTTRRVHRYKVCRRRGRR